MADPELTKQLMALHVQLAEVLQRVGQSDRRLARIEDHVSQGDNALLTRVKLLEAGFLEHKVRLAEAEKKREEIRREAIDSTQAFRKESASKDTARAASRGQVLAAILAGLLGLGGSIVTALAGWLSKGS